MSTEGVPCTCGTPRPGFACVAQVHTPREERRQMPTDDRCPRTDLLRSQCAHCRHGDRQPKRKLSTGEFGMPFLARYECSCANCGQPIHPGDVTARLSSAYGDGYGCVDCLP